MNTVQKIATNIAHRGREFGWKPGTKTANKLNIEAWAGAISALMATEHEDCDHVSRVAITCIAPGGYSATLRIADEAKAG